MELLKKIRKTGHCELSIQLQGLKYSYAEKQVFSGLDANFKTDNLYVITGQNGAGKSTLLKLLAGLLENQDGLLEHRIAGKKIPLDKLYLYVSACASWLVLPENLRVREFFLWMENFKPFIGNYTAQDIISRANLIEVQNSLIKNLSDGQYQRVSLFYALFVESVFSVLDEPIRALDAKSMELYKNALQEVSQVKTLFISSHQIEFYKDIPGVIFFHLCHSV